jgi:hypothetical protein
MRFVCAPARPALISLQKHGSTMHLPCSVAIAKRCEMIYVYVLKCDTKWRDMALHLRGAGGGSGVRSRVGATKWRDMALHYIHQQKQKKRQHELASHSVSQWTTYVAASRGPTTALARPMIAPSTDMACKVVLSLNRGHACSVQSGILIVRFALRRVQRTHIQT